MAENEGFNQASVTCAAPIVPLEFEGRAVRMRVDDEGNPWWVARDVCDILGLDSVSLAVNGRPDRPESGLPEDEKGVAIVNTPGGPQEMAVVNEPGVYRLVMRSRKPEAEAFRRWLFHEVIPSIRRHGVYVRPGQDPVVAVLEAMRDRRLAELELARRQAVLERRIDEAERTASAALAVGQANHGHYSVLGWARLCGRELDLVTASRIGKALSGICRATGEAMGSVRDPRFGKVQTYPESVLRDYFGDFFNGRVEL